VPQTGRTNVPAILDFGRSPRPLLTTRFELTWALSVIYLAERQSSLERFSSCVGDDLANRIH
jgi:hypothetical protein